VRCQWGDRPTHSDFLSRFPARREQIRAELARIDTELREESAVPRSNSLRVVAPTGLEAEIDQNPGVPWLSHHDVLLRRMIGSGRTGKVYEAWQQSTSRSVAVKFLRKSYLHQPGVVQRFVGEAGIIARLRHPNIVGIHGLGRTPAGAYFIVMELVAGSNLDLVTRTGPIPVAEAVRWVMETCKALEHAHSKGIIHCDLKPANLLLDRDGRLVVTDFGLARSLTGHTPWTTEVEGTAPYMAPEQASGYWGQVDVRTDVYGVGAVLFTLLTGRPPWVGRRLPDILADVISAAPVIPPTDLRPDLPEAISNVCRKCLSKAQESRYLTVQQVRSALTELIGGNR
jgi:eukaryotic-like serine/threonine-protein kinase